MPTNRPHRPAHRTASQAAAQRCTDQALIRRLAVLREQLATRRNPQHLDEAQAIREEMVLRAMHQPALIKSFDL